MPEEKKQSHIPKILRRVSHSSDVFVKSVIALALILVLGLMFPRGESIELDYKVGAVWARRDLIAPFSFPIFRDDKEYAREVEEAKKRVFPVFERDSTAEESQVRRLDSFFTHLREAVQPRITSPGKLHDNKSVKEKDSVLLEQSAEDLGMSLLPSEQSLLIGSEDNRRHLHTALSHAIRSYLRKGILDKDSEDLRRPEIALRNGNQEEIIPASRFYDPKDVARLLDENLIQEFGDDNDTTRLAYKIGVLYLTPNMLYDSVATAQAIQAAVETVPRTAGFVQQNERIVSKHERITPDTKLKLESLQRAKAERGAASAGPTQMLGILIHVSIIVMLYGIYLYLFRKSIFQSNRLLALVALLVLMEGFFAYLTQELNIPVPIEYLIFVPTAAMLLTIIFDSRVGFYGTVIIALLIAGIRGNDYSIALSSVVAGALAVYTVRDVKNRTQIFRSLGFIFLGYALSIAALALERFESMNVVLEELTFALANAIVSPVLTYGLLIFFERFFRVTTDLTLIELSHFNHPLMRLLAERAPGSYHHSMTMAGLAEAAASAVAANEVLARVGAYFHDIGKIEKPTYFVENQKGSRNRHEKLSPRMSALIIANHVKEGVALAHEYGLPQEVVDFIPMHHGTTRIEFFYRKAQKLAESSNDETKIDEIKEEDYRYPGPKPQTKETGILMLADAIEATARTLEDPAPQKLEVAIDELIKRRFEEGQLDECPLTLKDLTKIKTAFLGVLVGIYHSRIKYPEGEKKKRHDGEAKEQETGERLARTIKHIERE